MFSLYYKAIFVISLMLLGIYVLARHKHFDTKLTVIFTLIPISCLGYVFLDEAVNLREVIMSYKMIYIAGCFLQYLLLIYILELCTIKVTKCIKLIAFVLWMGVYLSVLSIGYFPLYYKKILFEIVDGKGRILKEYGFMHTVFYVMLFSFWGMGVYAILYSYHKKKQISKCTLILMLIPYVFSVFGYIIGSGHNIDVEITPIGYMMLEIAFLLVAYRMVLYDIDDSVIESMIQKGDTGLISFDYKFRYLGSNSVAKEIFPKLSELTIDSPITEDDVGGDFYDFFLVDDDHLCLFIADVSGKGIPASLFMMTSKTTIANIAMHGSSPSQIVTLANEAICANNTQDMFVTVWLGILEISTGKLVATNAGHEYPYVMKEGKFELLKDNHGMALGVVNDIKYAEYTINLSKGDVILLYTDGVAEAHNSDNELFGLERI